MGNNQEFLFFHNNPNHRHYLSAEAIFLERIDVKLVTYQNAVAGIEINDYSCVLHWFQKQQMKFLMLTRFIYIIHSNTPSNTKNKKYFSLAGIYTASRHANIFVERLPDLSSINRNSTTSGCNTPIDVFGGSLDTVAGSVDDTESNKDASTDASDTK